MLLWDLDTSITVLLLQYSAVSYSGPSVRLERLDGTGQNNQNLVVLSGNVGLRVCCMPKLDHG